MVDWFLKLLIKLEENIDDLSLENLASTKLKERNVCLENKVKRNEENEESLMLKLNWLKTRLKAYQNSAPKEIIDSRRIEK